VTDYQPKTVAKAKIKKEAPSLTLELVRTPDILTEVKGDFIKVGFAAESEDVVENAKKKLQKKQLDLIVANDITDASSGFGSDTNKVTLISRDGKVESLPLMSKREVADKILDRVVGLFSSKYYTRKGKGSKLTNHQRFVEAFKHRGGEALTTAEIETIILKKFPEMNTGSILPSDHTEKRVKGACWCAGTESRVFDRVARGQFNVRPNL
jgi:hypothetical protein